MRLFQYGVDLNIDPGELLLSLAEFEERHLGPAATALAEKLNDAQMKVSLRLRLPPVGGFETAIYQYDGLSMRGLTNSEEWRIPPKITIRFDVAGLAAA